MKSRWMLSVVATGLAGGSQEGEEPRPADQAPRERVVSAADREHWSFRPLREDPVPEIAASGRVRTPVDRFILAALEHSGLGLADEVDDRTLLRRLYFDLIGLPPTPEEIDEFLGSRSAAGAQDAYSSTVDTLLARKECGERWGRHWLDVARYADSDGYEFDVERPHAWPYRDFVMNALVEDMPYDQFLRWQLAGDEYQPGSTLARAATGFLTCGPTIDNQQNEKNRYDELDDMLSTIGSAMLGLTFGCARCHDHKYDAIPSRDYYRMLATLTTTQRREPFYAPEETVEVFHLQLKEHEQRLADAREGLAGFLGEQKQELRRRKVELLALPSADAELISHESDPTTPSWAYTTRDPGVHWMEEDFDTQSWKRGPGGFGTAGTPGAVIGSEWNQDRIFLRREFEWNEGAPSDLVFLVHHDDEVDIHLNGTLAAQASGHVVEYLVLEPTAEGMQALRPGRNLLAVHCRQESGGQFIDVHPFRRSRLEGRSPRECALDSPYLRLVRQHGEALKVDDESLRRHLTNQGQVELLAQWNRMEEEIRAVEAARPPEPERMLCIADQGKEPKESFLLFRGDPGAKQDRVTAGCLQVLSESGDLGPWWREPEGDAQSTQQRRAFAEWLTDSVHGAGALAARVAVNRLWRHHFGYGLVRTPGDFGTQGDRPSHPELLDWLARELVNSNWSLKHVHRLILLSSTYRQANCTDSRAHALDPDHRLWWRRPPMRLEAEILRDAILAVSGCLHRKFGGRSVKPWIPADAIATGSTEKWPKNVVDGPETWRRSVYVLTRRSVRFPMLEVFDAPDTTQSCTLRVDTVTSPQALAMLNNEFLREQSRYFARRLVRDCGADGRAAAPTAANESLVQRGYRLALGRNPLPRESDLALAFLEQEAVRLGAVVAPQVQGIADQNDAAGSRRGLYFDAESLRDEGSPPYRALVQFCQVLFNLNEFLYVD